MSTVIYTPYFYIIQHTNTGMYYAGSKYAKNANSNNFMIVDGYTTSSNIVNSIITEEGVDSFIIRKIKIFETGKEAYDYETKFLQKVNASKNPLFYNNYNNQMGTVNWTSELIDIKEDKRKKTNIERYGEAYPFNHYDENKEKIISTNIERYGVEYPSQRESHRLDMSERYQGEGNPFFGKKHTEETKSRWIDRIPLSGIEHPNFQGYFITPFGECCGKRKHNGIPYATLCKWCKNNELDATLSYNRSDYLKENYTYDEIRGKTFKELGFSYRKIK